MKVVVVVVGRCWLLLLLTSVGWFGVRTNTFGHFNVVDDSFLVGIVITCSLDHTVKFWKHGDRAALHSITFPTFINCLASDDEQRSLYVGGGNGTIYIVKLRAVASDRYKSTTGGFSTTGSSGSNNSLSASFGNGIGGLSSSFSSSSSSSSSAASSSGNPSNASSTNTMDKIEGSHDGPVNCLTLSSMGTTLFSGGGDGVVCAWDTTTRQQLFTVMHAGPVTNVLCMKRPSDLLRNKQGGSNSSSKGRGRHSSSANTSLLRPLPPLQKHRRMDHDGSTMTFLTGTCLVLMCRRFSFHWICSDFFVVVFFLWSNKHSNKWIGRSQRHH